MEKVKSFSQRKSKVIFNRLVEKLRSGISPEEFKLIIESENKSDNIFKEGEIFGIGPRVDENNQESEINVAASIHSETNQVAEAANKDNQAE